MKLDIELNINDNVIVELTPFGKKVIIENLQKLYKDTPHSLTKLFTKEEEIDLNVHLKLSSYEHSITDNGSRNIILYRFTLWNLMFYFGKEMYSGNENQCFVDNKLHLETDSSKRFSDFIL